MKLRVLDPVGRRLVTPELATGAVLRWPPSQWEPFVRDASRDIPLEGLDRDLDELVAKFPKYDTEMDQWLAPRLHRALPLSRREASEVGVFRFLAVVHRPDYIRHRWENLSWTNMRTRFWSRGTRHTSNAFARLWWIAETTRDGYNYTLTSRVLGRQTLATPVFVRTWSTYRPAVEAFVDLFEQANADTIERRAGQLSRHLATVPLEGLTTNHLKTILTTFQSE